MDSGKFDQITRGIHGRLTRRRGLAGLLGVLGLGPAVAATPEGAQAATDRHRCSPRKNTWCKDHCVNIHNNERHCGKCFHRCAKGEKCKRGTCRSKKPGVCTGNGNACRVFVTSTQSNGAFGGIDGADDQCQLLANTAGLSGTYLAWLAVDPVNPENRFDTSVGPYQLIDGTVIAADWDELTSATLRHAINLTETNLTVNDGVWTNVNQTGGYGKTGQSNELCSGFTETGAGNEAITGSSSATDSNWTYSAATPCSTSTLRLYCFEQPS